MRLRHELAALAGPIPFHVGHSQDPQADVRERGEGEELLRDRHGELVLSDTTVKTHVAHVLRKLGLRDRIQAVVFAYESGVVEPGA